METDFVVLVLRNEQRITAMIDANVTTTESDPVFIVGMNGSGTTMLLDHLGRHPNLYGFRLETYVLPGYLRDSDKYGDLAKDANFRRLWDDMRREFAFVKVNKRQPLDLPNGWSETPRTVAGVFDAIMREFARREGKSRWCEKTPLHVFHLQRLSEVFPTANFIHIIRDGRDCAASCWRRWGTHPVGAAVRWREAVEAGRQSAESLGKRYFETKYEEITARPQPVLEEICRFLDEPFSEEVLHARRVRPKMTGHASSAIVPNKGSRELLDRRGYAERIERVAGRTLSACGYECRYPDSETRVYWFHRFLWMINDAKSFLAHLIRGKAGAQPHLTWSLFWSRIKTTAKSKFVKR